MAARKEMPSGSKPLWIVSVFIELDVGVGLDGVALTLLGLGCDASVDGNSSSVQDCTGDDVARSESLCVAKGLFACCGGVNGLGDCGDGPDDGVVASCCLTCGATSSVCALGACRNSGMRWLQVGISILVGV